MKFGPNDLPSLKPRRNVKRKSLHRSQDRKGSGMDHIDYPMKMSLCRPSSNPCLYDVCMGVRRFLPVCKEFVNQGFFLGRIEVRYVILIYFSVMKTNLNFCEISHNKNNSRVWASPPPPTTPTHPGGLGRARCRCVGVSGGPEPPSGSPVPATGVVRRHFRVHTTVSFSLSTSFSP